MPNGAMEINFAQNRGRTSVPPIFILGRALDMRARLDIAGPSRTIHLWILALKFFGQSLDQYIRGNILYRRQMPSLTEVTNLIDLIRVPTVIVIGFRDQLRLIR